MPKIPRLLTLSLFLLAAPAAASEKNEGVTEAFEAFETVCLGGGGSFSADQVKAFPRKKLPVEVRKLAKTSLWLGGASANTPKAKAKDFPENVYVLLGSPKTFLMSPSPDPKNPIQSACSVFTKQSRFEEASKFAASASEQPYFQLGGQIMASYDLGKFRIVAASQHGWTQLSVVPKEFTLTDQSTKQNSKQGE